MLAVDGATTHAMAKQRAGIPGDATHLVVSVGGNDAPGHSDLLRAELCALYFGRSILERSPARRSWTTWRARS